MMQIEKVSYGGWPNCYRLKNDHAVLIVTTDIGPRVIHFGPDGEHNMFFVDQDTLGMVGGETWRLYGGHRLWTAPEDRARTYAADNSKVDVQITEKGIRFTTRAKESSPIQKQIFISLHTEKRQVLIEHRLKNLSAETITIAPWAVTVMAPGGTAILPLPARGPHPEHLLPSSSLALWPYTDLSDQRWHWGQEYIFLEHELSASNAQKIGLHCPDGWAAYYNQGCMFVKAFKFDKKDRYPDMNCNLEVFTDARLTEVESLGALTNLKQGKVVQHIEQWFLLDKFDLRGDAYLPYTKAYNALKAYLDLSL